MTFNLRRRAYSEYFVKEISAKILKRKKYTTNLINMAKGNWGFCDEQDRKEIKIYSAVKRSKSLKIQRKYINISFCISITIA